MIERFLSGLIMLYKAIVSPWMRPRCRFLPGCSDYGLEALEEWGSVKGTHLIIKRICRCHPWGGSGFDPVPKKNATVKG